jgi:hypothetical protein
MAIAFRSKNETVTTALDATVVEPAGAALNDVMLGVVAAASTATIGAPALWTELYSGNAVDFKFWIGWLRRTSSAPSLTWTTGSSIYREAHVLCYSGVDTTGSPIDNSDMNINNKVQDTANPNPPPIYAVDPNAMAVAIIIDWAGSASAWNGPTGYTIRTRNTTGDDVSVADKLLTVSGIEDPAAVLNRSVASTIKLASTITLRRAAPPSETLNIYAPCLR